LQLGIIKEKQLQREKTPLQIVIEKQHDIKNSIVKFKTTILNYKIQFSYKEDLDVGNVT